MKRANMFLFSSGSLEALNSPNRMQSQEVFNHHHSLSHLRTKQKYCINNLIVWRFGHVGLSQPHTKCTYVSDKGYIVEMYCNQIANDTSAQDEFIRINIIVPSS